MRRAMRHKIPALWLLVPTILALFCTFGWMWSSWPMAVDWGPVSSWVGSLGGLIAISFAGVQLRLVLRQRRLSLRDSLALIVDRVDGRPQSYLRVRVVNTGQFVVHDLRAHLVTLRASGWILAKIEAEPPGGVLTSGAEETVTLPLNADHGSAAPGDLGALITFTDIEGSSWSVARTASGIKVDLRPLVGD